MDDGSQRTPVLWDMLLPTQRLRLVRAFRDMALRRIRCAPTAEETPDDERGAHATAPRPAA